MKLVVAIIRPEQLEPVQRALNERDVYLMTVTDVRGFGRQKGHAELYRGAGHNQVVDACLSRESFIDVRETDRELARYVGGVLGAARADSTHLADAHVVAVAVEAGGGVIITVDEDDLTRLASGYPNIHIVSI